MALTIGLRGRNLAVARTILVVLPCFLLFGYNQSQIGGIVGFASFGRQFPLMDTEDATGALENHRAKIQGTVVAIYTIGCLIGALVCPTFGNRLGRRRTLALYASIATVGQILQSSSYSLVQLIIGRVISGLGVGGVNAIVPVWVSECSKPKNRGKSVVVLGMCIASGQALSAWINYGLGTIEDNPVAWRLPLAMPIVFTIMQISTVFLFPESPRWLVQQGRPEEAVEAKAVLEDTPRDSALVQAEIAAIQAAWHIEAQTKRTWWDILLNRSDRLLYRAFLAVAVNFSAQMTGANAVTYYAKTIFSDSLDFPDRQAAALAAGILSWKILSSSVSLFTVDRFGRKLLFMVSAAGMSIAMTCLTITVSLIAHPAAGKSATFFLFFYMGFFPVGFLGANFLYSAEIAPQDLRVHFAAIGTATHWLFNFVIAEITPICFAQIGYRTYIIYAVISASVIPLVWFTFPETTGRTLEDMSEIFSAPENWWQVPAAERKMHRSVMAQMEDKRDVELAHEKLGAGREERIEKV